MGKPRLKDILDDVEKETERFLARLKVARLKIKETYNENSYGGWIPNSKQNASLRRSALDLKNELTKITQSTN